jgi:quercetin dioxygenase-like cupin family protein
MDTYSAHRTGREAIADMPVREVREVDPAICEQIEALRTDASAPVQCDNSATMPLAEFAERADLPLRALVKGVQHGEPPADNTPPPRAEHRQGSRDHRESPEERLALPMAVFDVLGEIEQLQRELAWTKGDRNAKTLVKKPDQRIVLMVLKPGARLDEHFAPGSLALHMLFGRVRMAAGDHGVELSPGQMLTLDGGHRHEVEAIQESAFLLTLGW